MRFLANENFPLASVSYLSSKGHDLLAIGIDFAGTADADILQIAIQEERAILTFDRDYGELIFKHRLKPTNGIIYFRLTTYRPEEPGKIIESLLLTEGLILENRLTVVSEAGIRQRKFS